MYRSVALASSLLATAYAQQVGTLTTETHPTLSTEKCTTAGGCTAQSTKIVLDANWRWLHTTSGYTNCYTGNEWNTTICPDATTCASNCALDGADYSGTYGITSSGSSVKLDFVTTGGSAANVGSRVYLMASDSEYEMFSMLNQEFTFDVDVSNLPCGLNGALYFSQMDADGGMSKYPTNKAGAAYGTGYCDSQCPRDLKFINGKANVANWTADSNSANSGTGEYGSCCNEMDIWEANSISAAYTPHPCSVQGQTECSGVECGLTAADRYSGLCDADGCDFNSYRMGNDSFYGAAKTVDTSKVMTVVTQFITSDGTSSGTLSAIKRIYVQNGVEIQNSMTDISGVTATNEITDAFCKQQKTAFGDTDYFETLGGLATMGTAMKDMVLVLSIWDDYAANMLWLDSDYPLTKSASTAGVARGTCSTSSGVPATVESTNAGASVTYSNIKWGDLNSTFST